MAKILLLVIAFAAAFWLLRRYRRQVDSDTHNVANGAAEDMVRCAGCGIHVPRVESFGAEGRFFCSPEHERDFRNAR